VHKLHIVIWACHRTNRVDPLSPGLFEQDPKHAITAMPEVAATLAIGALTLLGTLLSLFGLIGSSKPTIQVKQSTTIKADKKGPVAPIEPVSAKEQVALDQAGVATGKEIREEAVKRNAAGKTEL
jgi:hypothetical protein